MNIKILLELEKVIDFDKPTDVYCNAINYKFLSLSTHLEGLTPPK